MRKGEIVRSFVVAVARWMGSDLPWPISTDATHDLDGEATLPDNQDYEDLAKLLADPQDWTDDD